MISTNEIISALKYCSKTDFKPQTEKILPCFEFWQCINSTLAVPQIIEH